MIVPTPQMVKQEFDKRFAEFTEEEKRNFRYRFIVHDYEVFPNAALLGSLDISTGEYWSTWGCREIMEHLRKVFLRNLCAVLVGYNNKGFDNRISDAILDGMNETQLKQFSDELINTTGFPRWRSSNGYRPEWVKRTFDIGFDIGQKYIGDGDDRVKIPEVSLKKWQRLNGIKVHRSELSFDKPLIYKSDYKKTEKYCESDVCSTALVLLSREGWDPCLNARRVLVDDYEDRGVDWVMTKPNITSIVLNAKKENYTIPKNWEDEKFVIPPNLRLFKNTDLYDIYSNTSIGKLREMSSKEGGGGVAFKNNCGIPHVFGVGGVHGCYEGIWKSHGGGIYSIDAASLYPNMMRHYNYLSRRVIGSDRDKFGNLIDLRVNVYKPRGDRRADGLKLVLNGGFGAMGFESSDMYDPVNFSSVTILGQLLMTDLMEKLERHIILVQSNTDGLFFRLRNETEEGLAQCKLIVNAFEKRTKLEMEWEEYEAMHQKDVSNYVCRSMPKKGQPAGSGKLTAKGGIFFIKHCTVFPYLTLARQHAALNNGEMLSPDGLSLDRFAIETKRDKNSECFLVDGKPDERKWLDVVPIDPCSSKKQRIEVLCKDDGTMEDTLFGDMSDDVSFRKRRKATNCPEYAALTETVKVEDIDLKWYESQLNIGDEKTKVNKNKLF